MFLGRFVSTNEYVAIKVKKEDVAVKEARFCQYLRGMKNIPIYYGLLSITKPGSLGIIHEYIGTGLDGMH